MFLDTLLSEYLSLSEAWLPIKVNPSLQQILTPVMTHIVIDKSTDNAKPQLTRGAGNVCERVTAGFGLPPDWIKV